MKEALFLTGKSLYEETNAHSKRETIYASLPLEKGPGKLFFATDVFHEKSGIKNHEKVFELFTGGIRKHYGHS